MALERPIGDVHRFDPRRAVLCAIVASLALTGCGGEQHHQRAGARAVTEAGETSSGCAPAPVHRGAPPAWARVPGVPHAPLAYALGSGDRLAAFLFTDPLRARLPRGTWNKVLFVIGGGTRAPRARITARRADAPHLAVRIRAYVGNGSGRIQRSTFHLPRAGCWRLTVRWASHRATLDVRVQPPVSETLPCADVVGTSPPGAHSETILGVAALPTSTALPRALQTLPSDLRAPSARLFSKWVLVIRAGATFDLVVPRRWSDRLAIGWGSPAHRARRVHVSGCRARGARWLAYAGGYWVPHPACVPLLVRAHGRQRRVEIGVGAPCPHQRPAPEPTTS